MIRAHIHLEGVLGRRVELKELAEMTTRAHGEKSFSQGKLSGYRLGAVNPSVDVLAAYAKATRVDPGWLAFGRESEAPAPAEQHAPAPTAKRGGRAVPEPSDLKKKRSG
jgi:transcriptional regulator with XRE-family HTH domain